MLLKPRKTGEYFSAIGALFNQGVIYALPSGFNRVGRVVVLGQFSTRHLAFGLGYYTSRAKLCPLFSKVNFWRLARSSRLGISCLSSPRGRTPPNVPILSPLICLTRYFSTVCLLFFDINFRTLRCLFFSSKEYFLKKLLLSVAPYYIF